MLNHALVEMERNRTLWKENSLHNYRFILDVAPYDPLPPASPAVLEVKEGENVSVELEEWALGSYKDPYKNYDTMGKLYSIIERAVMQKAKYIDVEYDERLGYPRRISIDYGPIDTRILLKVLRFEIL
jgi:hypothetical protein